MNAASRVIDGAAEGKDGKRHGAASFELRASGFDLRASSGGGRGYRLLQAAPLTKSRDLGAFARTRPEEAAENSFFASATCRCTRRPRRRGPHQARFWLDGVEMPSSGRPGASPAAAEFERAASNLHLVMSVLRPMPTPLWVRVS